MGSKNKYIVCIVETRTMDVQHLEYNTKRFYIGWMGVNIQMKDEKTVSRDYASALLNDKKSAAGAISLYKRSHPLRAEMKRTIEIIAMEQNKNGDFEIVLPDIFDEFAKNDRHTGNMQKPVRWFTDVYNMTIEEVLYLYGKYLKSDKYLSWKERNAPDADGAVTE